MKPPKPDKPLSSEELEQDARETDVASDELTHGGGDTHLPASESGVQPDEDEDRPNPMRNLANLPPG